MNKVIINAKSPSFLLTQLDLLAEVVMGQSPPSENYNSAGVGLPFFQGKAEFGKTHPAVRKWCPNPTKIARESDILVSVRAPVGSVNIADQLCGIGRGLAAIRYEPCPKFLYYYFVLIEQKLDELGTGTTFRAISGDVLRKTQIYLPPLAEQHRIVAKLEELLSELDKGIEDLKTVREKMKVFRQGVLKYAFEGRLTNPELKEGELPEGWKIAELNLLCDINPKLPVSEYSEGLEVTFLPMKNVAAIKNKIDVSEKRTLREVRKGFTPIAEGDVIFAKITPCMENGKIAIATGLLNGIAFGSTEFHVFRCKPDVSNRYIFHFLVQERTRNAAEQQMTGAVGQRRVPKKFLEDLKIALPVDFHLQNAVVDEIESRLSMCDHIETLLEETLRKSESLKQSILKKAFAGELVPQDPNDEPASVLLERIKAERESVVKTVKTAKTTLKKVKTKI